MTTHRLPTSQDEAISGGLQRLVFVRIKETGTQGLVAALRECSFAACAPRKSVHAVNSWDCSAAVALEWRRLSSRATPFFERSCFIDAYCPWDVVGPLATGDQSALAAMANSTRVGAVAEDDDDLVPKSSSSSPFSTIFRQRAFVVTMVRDAVERVVTEFAHVCTRAGGGRGDYSTADWRRTRRPELERLRSRPNFDDDYTDTVYGVPKFSKPAYVPSSVAPDPTF